MKIRQAPDIEIVELAPDVTIENVQKKKKTEILVADQLKAVGV